MKLIRKQPNEETSQALNVGESISRRAFLRDQDAAFGTN